MGRFRDFFTTTVIRGLEVGSIGGYGHDYQDDPWGVRLPSDAGMLVPGEKGYVFESHLTAPEPAMYSEGIETNWPS